MRSSEWLAVEDIVAFKGGVTVTIEKVNHMDEVEFEQGRKEKNKHSIKFVGKEKELILNSGNRRTLYRLFGADTKDWKGKSITLVVDPNVRCMGKVVGGIRFKESVTKAEVPK